MSDAMSDSENADRVAAVRLMIQYAACIDDLDFEGFRACFADEIELSGFSAEPFTRPEEWVAFVQRVIKPFTGTQHMLGPPQVELQGDRAELRTALQAQHFHRDPVGRIMTVWGTYRTTAVRTAVGWRIQRHRLDIAATRTSDAFQSQGL
jgi:3-phenylpropionate/cinnamic acid dioxygenase small subunit